MQMLGKLCFYNFNDIGYWIQYYQKTIIIFNYRIEMLNKLKEAIQSNLESTQYLNKLEIKINQNHGHVLCSIWSSSL